MVTRLIPALALLIIGVSAGSDNCDINCFVVMQAGDGIGKAKAFLTGVGKPLKIGTKHHVGGVVYNSIVSPIPYGAITSPAAYAGALAGVQAIPGPANLGVALGKAVDVMAGRKSAPTALFIVTDGKSDDDFSAQIAALRALPNTYIFVAFLDGADMGNIGKLAGGDATRILPAVVTPALLYVTRTFRETLCAA